MSAAPENDTLSRGFVSSMEVTDRIAVVTGATSGIGKATAKRLAAAGSHVALLARTESDLESVAGTIRDTGGTASVFPVDLADRAAVESTADRIAATVGDPDILVNSAGIGDWIAAWEADPGQFERIMAVTVFGAYNLAKRFLPAMLERDRGHIVTIESPAAHAPLPGATAYQTARYALRGLTESLRVDLHSTGVGVTSIIPGVVDTEYFERNDNVEERLPGTAAPLDRVDPETVADGVLTGIRTGKNRVYVPRLLRLLVLARRAFPNRLDALTARFGWQPGDAE